MPCDLLSNPILAEKTPVQLGFNAFRLHIRIACLFSLTQHRPFLNESTSSTAARTATSHFLTSSPADIADANANSSHDQARRLHPYSALHRWDSSMNISRMNQNAALSMSEGCLPILIVLNWEYAVVNIGRFGFAFVSVGRNRNWTHVKWH
jgi:hypothetical protein